MKYVYVVMSHNFNGDYRVHKIEEAYESNDDAYYRVDALKRMQPLGTFDYHKVEFNPIED